MVELLILPFSVTAEEPLTPQPLIGEKIIPVVADSVPFEDQSPEKFLYYYVARQSPDTIRLIEGHEDDSGATAQEKKKSESTSAVSMKFSTDVRGLKPKKWRLGFKGRINRFNANFSWYAYPADDNRQLFRLDFESGIRMQIDHRDTDRFSLGYSYKF